MRILKNTPSLRVLGLAAALAALGGCAVYPNDATYAGGPGVMAPYGPPPLVAESYGVAPFPGAFWINGYWGWSAGRHAWTPGRWEHPRHGHRWVPRTWEHRGNQRHRHGGHWERH
jgi:hypothetical protein